MSLILLTPPAAEPVSLAGAKSWLRVETDAEDLERYGIADDIIIAGAGSAGMQHYGGYQRNT